MVHLELQHRFFFAEVSKILINLDQLGWSNLFFGISNFVFGTLVCGNVNFVLDTLILSQLMTFIMRKSFCNFRILVQMTGPKRRMIYIHFAFLVTALTLLKRVESAAVDRNICENSG